jgi:hypothetical protein
MACSVVFKVGLFGVMINYNDQYTMLAYGRQYFVRVQEVFERCNESEQSLIIVASTNLHGLQRTSLPW